MRSSVGAFLLGVAVAWVGLPRLIHVAYWSGIAISFAAGYLVHR